MTIAAVLAAYAALALDATQLAAVIAHEHAHLRAHHQPGRRGAFSHAGGTSGGSWRWAEISGMVLNGNARRNSRPPAAPEPAA